MLWALFMQIWKSGTAFVCLELMKLQKGKMLMMLLMMMRRRRRMSNDDGDIILQECIEIIWLMYIYIYICLGKNICTATIRNDTDNQHNYINPTYLLYLQTNSQHYRLSCVTEATGTLGTLMAKQNFDFPHLGRSLGHPKQQVSQLTIFPQESDWIEEWGLKHAHSLKLTPDILWNPS